MPSDNDIVIIADELDRAWGLDALWVYGSVAAGRATERSDLDLAVLVRARPSVMERTELAARLSGMIGVEVDLVELDRCSPVLGMQVLRKGARVVVNDPLRAGLVEARLFSQYADLKRARAPVERAIVARHRHGG